jgi:hypothetical protein
MANGSAPAPRYWVRGELDISRRRNVGHRPSKPCTERPCSVLRRAMWGDIRSRVPRCVPKLGRGNPETARVYRSQSRTGRPRSARPAIQPTATEARRGSLALCGSAVAMHRTRLRPRPSGRAARWSPLAHRGEGSARGRPSGRQRVQRCRCLSDTEQVDRGVTVSSQSIASHRSAARSFVSGAARPTTSNIDAASAMPIRGKSAAAARTSVRLPVAKARWKRLHGFPWLVMRTHVRMHRRQCTNEGSLQLQPS